MKTRQEAESLLFEYTEGDSLRKHARAVEASMRWYAKEFFKLSADEIEHYGITGLLHDFDYEKFPDPTPPDGHPYKGKQILEEKGYPADMIEAIQGHAEYTGVPRVTQLAKTLFAVDELSGLITAAVYVRPDKSVHNLEVSSVMKKMKDKAFARGCNRDDIRKGAEELGLQLEVHIGNVIQALRDDAVALGLNGV